MSKELPNSPSLLDDDEQPEEVILPVGERSPWQINPGVTRRRAKELYLIYGWDKQRLLTLGMPEPTLNHWLYNPTDNHLSWKQEKDILDESILSKMKEGLSEEASKLGSKLLSILQRTVSEWDLSGEALKNPKAFKDVVDALSKIHQLRQLEDGKPTSIKASTELTQKEIGELVGELQQLDPFIDYDPSGGVN